MQMERKFLIFVCCTNKKGLFALWSGMIPPLSRAGDRLLLPCLSLILPWGNQDEISKEQEESKASAKFTL